MAQAPLRPPSAGRQENVGGGLERYTRDPGRIGLQCLMGGYNLAVCSSTMHMRRRSALAAYANRRDAVRANRKGVGSRPVYADGLLTAYGHSGDSCWAAQRERLDVDGHGPPHEGAYRAVISLHPKDLDRREAE